MRDFTGVSGASGGLADSDTRWTHEVANALVQEVANVITTPAGGNTALNPADNGQLLAAILQAFVNAFPVTTNINGHCIDFGFCKVQMGEAIVPAGGSSTSTGFLSGPVRQRGLAHFRQRRRRRAAWLERPGRRLPRAIAHHRLCDDGFGEFGPSDHRRPGAALIAVGL